MNTAALETPRIASLVPSLTELAVALGLGPYLVARTGFCIHPAEVMAALPKVGGTKDVNLAKLRRLRPSHVLLNVDENRLDLVDALRAWGAPAAPDLIVTHPLGPEDNIALVEQLASAFGAVAGVRQRATELIESLRQELEQTQPQAFASKRVLYLIWRRPWMTVARDTYISRMLGRVGLQTLPALSGGSTGSLRYPVVDGGEPWLCTVDEVWLSSEPCRFDDDDAAEAQRLCPQARVRRVDGELLSWYGVRALAGLRYLRQLRAES
jgi:ABC-type Fe3+-hydroxamate transport system substrate-binding protein